MAFDFVCLQTVQANSKALNFFSCRLSFAHSSNICSAKADVYLAFVPACRR